MHQSLYLHLAPNQTRSISQIRSQTSKSQHSNSLRSWAFELCLSRNCTPYRKYSVAAASYILWCDDLDIQTTFYQTFQITQIWGADYITLVGLQIKSSFNALSGESEQTTRKGGGRAFSKFFSCMVSPPNIIIFYIVTSRNWNKNRSRLKSQGKQGIAKNILRGSRIHFTVEKMRPKPKGAYGFE